MMNQVPCFIEDIMVFSVISAAVEWIASSTSFSVKFSSESDSSDSIFGSENPTQGRFSPIISVSSEIKTVERSYKYTFKSYIKSLFDLFTQKSVNLVKFDQKTDLFISFTLGVAYFVTYIWFLKS